MAWFPELGRPQGACGPRAPVPSSRGGWRRSPPWLDGSSAQLGGLLELELKTGLSWTEVCITRVSGVVATAEGGPTASPFPSLRGGRPAAVFGARQRCAVGAGCGLP